MQTFGRAASVESREAVERPFTIPHVTRTEAMGVKELAVARGRDGRRVARVRGPGPRPPVDLGRGGALALALLGPGRGRHLARHHRGRLPPPRATGDPRVHRHLGHHGRGGPGTVAVHLEGARGLVLRRADGHGDGPTAARLAGPVLRPGGRLRRSRPAHAGLVRPHPDAVAASGRTGPQDHGRLRPVDPAPADRRPPVQPRRLQLRGPGRDDEPPHQPVPLRPRACSERRRR